jgi:hypothetical protein
MGEGARAAPNAVPWSRLLAVTLAAAQSLDGGAGACRCNPTALVPRGAAGSRAEAEASRRLGSGRLPRRHDVAVLSSGSESELHLAP